MQAGLFELSSISWTPKLARMFASGPNPPPRRKKKNGQFVKRMHARAVGKAKIEFALVSTIDKNNAPSQTIKLEVEVKAAASK